MSDLETGPIGSEPTGEQLAAWVGDVQPLVMRLETWHTPEHFRPDMTVESLDVLEEAIVLTYEPEGTDDSQDFLQGAMAYLGEALMHIGGGRWGWSLSGHPVVCPDPHLRLEPLDPLKLITAAQEVGDFAQFAQAAQRLRTAVDAYQGQHAGWKPVKEPTPGLDPWTPVEKHPRLAQWLTLRQDGFAAWVEETGQGAGVWDFSPASLDILGRLVLDRYTTQDQISADEESSFIQGAIWYIGEVAVRHKNGNWTYRDAPDGVPREEVEKNIYLERPFINQPSIRKGRAGVPFYYLRATVRDDDATDLSQRIAHLKDPAPDSPVIYRAG
ncbi:hypothetical protein ACFW1M_01150 [Streptomyces inhibens]|uniref:hypothetical protein n=1 Tax=Streptomyces inhibens TaxID=2293571 RepID=UPI0036CD95FF